MWGGGPKAQAPASKGLTSPKSGAPSEGTGNEKTGFVEESLGVPRELFTAPNRKGHLDSPALQQIGLPPQMKRDALAAENWSF